MPFQVALPIGLRIGAAAVFLIAVLVAGAMNRPFIIVPLLAAAATATQFMANKIAPSPIAQLGSALDPSMSPKPSLNRLWVSFLLGTFGYAVLFILTVFISAIFQETELARALTLTDLWILLIPAGSALVLSVINARITAVQVTSMMGNLHSAFGEQTAANDTEPFTVEGEIIDPDEPDS